MAQQLFWFYATLITFVYDDDDDDDEDDDVHMCSYDQNWQILNCAEVQTSSSCWTLLKRQWMDVAGQVMAECPVEVSTSQQPSAHSSSPPSSTATPPGEEAPPAR